MPPGSQPLIHRGRKGSYETFEPGATLEMKGNFIGATPFQDYKVDGTLGVDTNDGFAWGAEGAFKTIGKAFTAITALATRGRARILVAPGGYSEDLVTPLNADGPFIQVIAWNPTTQSFGAVFLSSATATEPNLTIKARGWGFYGFEFDAPSCRRP